LARTATVPVATSTSTEVTPSSLPMLLLTELAQPPQVMPTTV
jgi:hypothetical protein